MEQTSLDFSNLLKQYGLSDASSNWLQRVPHPAGGNTSSCIPDLSRIPSLCMDFRPTMVIATQESFGTSDWDCLIWCPPGDATGAIVVVGPAGTDFEHAVPIGTSGGSVVASVLSLQTGVETAAITFGRIFEAQSAPATLAFQTLQASSLPQQFRTNYRSLTASLTASALNNQGTVYSTQFARQSIDSRRQRPFPEARGVTNAAAEVLTYLPFNENTLNIISPSAETRPAKDGVYMPLRLCGPTQPFVQPCMVMDGTLVQYTQESSGSTPYDTSYYKGIPNFINDDATGVDGQFTISCLPVPVCNPAPGDGVPPWATAVPVVVSGSFDYIGFETAFSVLDLGYDNCSHGVTIFRGLDPAATITLQMYVGLEIIPRTDSPVRSFVTVPPPPDPRALHIYYDIVNSMPVSYPAKYNSFGLLLPLLYRALRVVIPHVPGMIRTAVEIVREIRRPQAAVTTATKNLLKQSKKSKKSQSAQR